MKQLLVCGIVSRVSKVSATVYDDLDVFIWRMQLHCNVIIRAHNFLWVCTYRICDLILVTEENLACAIAITSTIISAINLVFKVFFE